jgi:hypothetical protein
MLCEFMYRSWGIGDMVEKQNNMIGNIKRHIRLTIKKDMKENKHSKDVNTMP